MTLAGKVAILTGGGGGIGVASAIAFARSGATVVVMDAAEHLAATAADQVRTAGGQAEHRKLDVLQEDQVTAAFSDVAERYGHIDVLFNLAGTTVLSPAIDLSLDDFDRVMRLNVTGQFTCARTAARHMIEAGTKGSIINIGSVFSLGGIPRRAAYTASRAAIVNLTRTLAVEWALHAIRVNCIAPTWTLTEGLLQHGQQINVDALADRIPMGRLAEPDEVANVALFLASDSSSFVTGVTIPVDGGMTAYLGPNVIPASA